MSVAELIEQLQSLPAYYEVMVSDEEGEQLHVVFVANQSTGCVTIRADLPTPNDEFWL